VQVAILEHGIRNALLTSIAPTGTISLFADNVSSGLEPVFSFNYTRTVLMPDGSRQEEEVSDYAVRLFRHLHGEQTSLPDYFVDAQTLTPHDHIVMQAVAQKFIDSAISKTINVAEDIDFQSFKDVYLEAYESGCKGCTTYRPNEITGAILKIEKKVEPEPEPPKENSLLLSSLQPALRPEELPGNTYKLKWAESSHAIYITINDTIKDGRRRPFEVFINSKNIEHFAWAVALTRMISAVFRRGGDVRFVYEELKSVFDPRGGQWMGGKYVPSLLAAIGGIIERHMTDIGFMADTGAALAGPHIDELQIAVTPLHVVSKGNADKVTQCPSCGEFSMVHGTGCPTCRSCGFSKCS